MAELSHRALRELIHGFTGPGVVYHTEMISAPGLLTGGPFEKWYLDSGPCPRQLVYQLLGPDTDHLVKAAILLDREESLGIDINMGCSAPAITRTGSGVRWMEDPDKAAGLVEALRKVTKKQISAKIRLGPKPGRNQKSEKIPNLEALIRFCRGMEAAGLDMITLHPRLAEEKFKRRARWEYVEALRKELRIPVTGNGDIASAEELARRAAAGPVMSGRLLVREPWAFAAALTGRFVKENASSFGAAPDDQLRKRLEETGLRFLELLARYQPPEFHLSRARRFFRYYCDNVTWAEHLRNKINREETLTGIERVWQDYFKETPGN
ncbi:MAG: tRNA-dihydrouridine synthase family protein [Treponema sp.]|nr:tRNA-dihydrouridine synthase family protein [Treponema sp.]